MDGADLPVLGVLAELRRALDSPGAAVLVAPPGTGKTTAVPPALVEEPWADGRIIVVEPRRLAARAAAARMASNHSEEVGGRFGYSVRHDRAVSDRTRVEVVTEGLLLRRIQGDPSLEGISAVVLDEFHERSVDLDLALALLIDARTGLRPDLRLLVMSATLGAEPVAALLGGHDGPAPIVRSDAPLFGVDTHYRPGSAHDRLEDRTAVVVREALTATEGDVLVFLPGRGEISGTARRLGRSDRTEVMELHGSTPLAAQRRILDPHAEGPRRVILATAVAETSVTVPGVRVVVDAGRRRFQEVNLRNGLPALVTRNVSRAGADQRRGRAGREAPGVCFRLWSASEDHLRAAHDPAEITVADLAPLLLQVLGWGAASPDELSWIDPPPNPAVERAHELLADLGGLGPDGRLTPLGRRMASFGFHPRLGAIAASAGDEADLAADVVAVLDVGGPGDPDVAERVRALRSGRAGPEAERSRKQWRDRIAGGGRRGARARRPNRERIDDDALDRLVGRLVLAGFADRVARRRDSRDRPVYQLRHGGEVELRDSAASLAVHDWIVVADLDARTGAGTPGRLHLGAGLHPQDVRSLLEGSVTEERVATFDEASGVARGTIRRSLDAITVETRPWRSPDAEAITAAVLDAVRRSGPSVLGRWHQAEELRRRVAFLAAHGVPAGSGPWPDMSEEHLASTAEVWLGPFLGGGSRRRAPDPARVDVLAALMALLSWEDTRVLDSEAPTHWIAGDGRRFRLEYAAVDGDPSSVLLAAKLQRLLGIDDHPTLGSRRIPISVELLSPARRPVQRTLDLPGFWRGSYAQVRAEMRSKYRKHPWPEHPESAEPPPERRGR